jgi:hypothetical protein
VYGSATDAVVPAAAQSFQQFLLFFKHKASSSFVNVLIVPNISTCSWYDVASISTIDSPSYNCCVSVNVILRLTIVCRCDNLSGNHYWVNTIQGYAPCAGFP